MSIKIHHGPPGSYKTSGAIMDDFIPACRHGRVIVTNIRGVSKQRCEDVLDDLPETFDVISLPTSDHPDAVEHMRLLSKWWHWAPLGAFLMIDEAQMVFPKSWTEKDLQALAYPDGPEAAAAAGRPYDFRTAFDMHRHFGWDIVLTTPKITKIRDDVRGASEGAYKHKNLALVGIGGRYAEGFHMAEDSGASESDILTLRFRKIVPEVWKLYDSTATGQIADTRAGLSFLQNPKVLGLLLFLVGLFAFAFSRPVPAIIGGQGRAVPAVTAVAAPAVAGPGAASGGGVAAGSGGGPPRHDGVDSVAVGQRSAADFLSGYQVRIAGSYSDGISGRRLFHLRDGSGGELSLWTRDLVGMGYAVDGLSECLVRLRLAGAADRLVTCQRFRARMPAPGPMAASDDVGGARRR